MDKCDGATDVRVSFIPKETEVPELPTCSGCNTNIGQNHSSCDRYSSIARFWSPEVNVESSFKPLMKVREHRGGFQDSMSTYIEIEPTLEALTFLIVNRLKGFGYHFIEDRVKLTYVGLDHRENWGMTFIIEVDGYGVWGFCNQMIK